MERERTRQGEEGLGRLQSAGGRERLCATQAERCANAQFHHLDRDPGGRGRADDAGLPATLKSQEALGLEKPSELYVDGAYVSAAALAEAQSQGRELVGPAQPSPTKRPAGFRTEDFQVDVEERRALRPAGKENTQCSRLEEDKSGKVSYRFEWSTHCHGCARREQCAGPEQKHRTLVVGQHHSLLQQRRREQQTEAFKERMKVRNAIEGTQSELVRGHGLRRARYRGKRKVDLQNQLIGGKRRLKDLYRWPS